MHANFALLGMDVGPDLGKRGPASDLLYYDKREGGVTRTWVHPAGFPDKVQPMVQAIATSEFAVFYPGSLDRFAGEQILALDMMGVKTGVLSHPPEVDAGRLESMIRGTVLEGYSRAEPGGIREAVLGIRPVTAPGPPRAVITQSFDVRGVGTVLLGNVTSGVIRQYDKMVVHPAGTEVLVKSIQVHDEPVPEAPAPARVGLAVKGVSPDEVSRGDVLAAEAAVSGAVELDYEPCRFYKGDLAAGSGCVACIGAQAMGAQVSSVSPVSLDLSRPAVCEPGQVVLLLRPESDGARIIGSGRIR
ncbi:MAG: EF-Tu/IF-2/RF-3 family GTPase [Nitrosopumilus sp.]|nr:EF-Tu/IF-2/RF-3 family GTPase [Nitrosopumilus sp.]